MGDIVDEIDALVDEQMAGGETAARSAPSVPQFCPLCWRDWHGLAITQRMEDMRIEYGWRDYDEDGETDYAESAILDGYRYDLDESRVLCPGPGYLGPLPEWAMCQCRSCWYRRLMQTWRFDDVFDPTSWLVSVGHLRTESGLEATFAHGQWPSAGRRPLRAGSGDIRGRPRWCRDPGARGILIGRFRQTASLRARLHQLTRGWV